VLRPRALRGLTDTKEGRLTIIVIVGGLLVVGVSWANIAMAHAIDDEADAVRAALRRELRTIDDATLAAYPGTADRIEQAAAAAIVERSARVVGSDRPDRDEIVVAVDVALGWQNRCVTVELRGAATVLTERALGPC
jgi:hypothetical protein